MSSAFSITLGFPWYRNLPNSNLHVCHKFIKIIITKLLSQAHSYHKNLAATDITKHLYKSLLHLLTFLSKIPLLSINLPASVWESSSYDKNECNIIKKYLDCLQKQFFQSCKTVLPNAFDLLTIFCGSHIKVFFKATCVFYICKSTPPAGQPHPYQRTVASRILTSIHTQQMKSPFASLKTAMYRQYYTPISASF